MNQFAVSLLCILSIFSCALGQSASCKEISKSSDLPCIEVSSCSSKQTLAKVEVNKLSNGLGLAHAKSVASFCHTADHLQITIDSFNQTYFPSSTQFSSCNDNVFNLDVVEVFISPHAEAPNCYSEIDVSPYNAIFESGIYNPNLNHTGVENYLIDCNTSNIVHQTHLDKSNSKWSSIYQLPWKVIDNPYGCPKSTLDKHDNIYRANIFRVNEMASTTKCSSSLCEYMAWSPTFSNPPAFHEPKYFGYVVLI